MAIEINDGNFEREVLESRVPVLVDFFAKWCVPCKMIAPVIDEVSGEVGDKVKVFKMDVEESGQTAARYGIMSVPTLMIFNEGKEAAKTMGALPKSEILNFLAPYTR